MEPEILLKMEEAVIDILKKADMDYMTEFNVRVAASERIGVHLSDIYEDIDQSGDESFLLSTMVIGGKEDKEAELFNGGISLTAEQWSAFRKSIPLIEEAIIRMKSKLWATSSTHRLNGEASNLVTASTPCVINTQISNLATSSIHGLNGEASSLVTASMAHELNEHVSTSVTNSTPNEPKCPSF
ncbi:hypothetical protein GH714_038432 [Hevea brasiliensis]|uniref:DEK-C domain-containing protein n=1 Tax=Hevea brasiliensis TaxID=3981 RepID=A0A6A6MQB2_HEVBR|nr:hypothetical protein GH714_038432 [Hevea brasiliensis]